jgi:hypothetical protein
MLNRTSMDPSPDGAFTKVDQYLLDELVQSPPRKDLTLSS